jgi:plasmid stabilization system protein ParE
MIVRWTAGALADLISIENYQRLHWPRSRAAFEQRLTAIERRIAEFPFSAPKSRSGPAYAWSHSSISPTGFLQR